MTLAEAPPPKPSGTPETAANDATSGALDVALPREEARIDVAETPPAARRPEAAQTAAPRMESERRPEKPAETVRVDLPPHRSESSTSPTEKSLADAALSAPASERPSSPSAAKLVPETGRPIAVDVPPPAERDSPIAANETPGALAAVAPVIAQRQEVDPPSLKTEQSSFRLPPTTQPAREPGRAESLASAESIRDAVLVEYAVPVPDPASVNAARRIADVLRNPADRVHTEEPASPADRTTAPAVAAQQPHVARQAPSAFNANAGPRLPRAAAVRVEPDRAKVGVGDDTPRSLFNAAVPIADSAATRVNRADAGRESAINLPRDPAALSLRLPNETELPPRYVQRAPEQRASILERMGGSDETERAVASALQWLARYQSADGRWDGAEFDERCRCGGATDYEVDSALTGLALLCFLGAGHTHVKDGPYRETVARGLNWLAAQQRPEGDLRRGVETLYSQGIAAIALSEAYGMTTDASLREVVERAVAFIVKSRNERTGGWRYEPGQDGDTSVLGWQIMALKSAQLAGIDVPKSALDSAEKWLGQVSPQNRPGLYSYRPRQPASPSMTAEGTFVRQLLGAPRDAPGMAAALQFIAREPPSWKMRPNTYYWYYATLALFHRHDDAWEHWNKALVGELLPNQRQDGNAAGSWDPIGEWAPVGGRVYQTAICTLMLEVYYRYLPLYSLDRAIAEAGGPSGTRGASGDAAPRNLLRGRVTDAATGRPLAGAAIRLDLSEQPPVSVRSTADGFYELSIPETPEFFAVSAMLAGYQPAAGNVSEANLRERGFYYDFALRPAESGVIALEAAPDVHHLGNDRFEGAINSQFQKASEGRAFSAEFLLSPTQSPPHIDAASVVLLAKGVQCPHQVRINGTLIEARLDHSPADGSFGEIVLALDPALLSEGSNTLEIRAVTCRGDLDDFEFVNVQLRLSGGSMPKAVLSSTP